MLDMRHMKTSDAYKTMGLSNKLLRSAFWNHIQSVIVKHDLTSFHNKEQWSELVNAALSFYACTCKESYEAGCQDTILKVHLVLRDRLKRYRSKKDRFGNTERAYKRTTEDEDVVSAHAPTENVRERIDDVRSRTESERRNLIVYVFDPSKLHPDFEGMARSVRTYEPSSQLSEGVYMEHITVEDYTYTELLFRINEVLPENRYIREQRGYPPEDSQCVQANQCRLFADDFCPLKSTNLRVFYESASSDALPVVVAVMGRELTSDFHKRDKKAVPRPDSPPPARSQHLDAPPPPQTFYEDVNDMIPAGLVGVKGVPRTHLGFEQQLAHHRLKIKAHQEIIKNLKDERSKLGEDDPIDSDDDLYEAFNNILPEDVRTGISAKELRIARKEARRSAVA